MTKLASQYDLCHQIDEQPIGALQIRVFILCASVALLDGLDTQSIATAAPAIAAKLQFSRAALGPVFAAGHFGAFTGAFIFGPLADRIGRKRALVIASCVMGLLTILTGFATSYTGLVVTRFGAGLGLGGAAPCFIVLASEYAPRRKRAMIASMMWAAFPLGGAIGGFVNAYLFTAFGWQSIFVVGGSLPLLLTVVVARFLPESPSFLTARGRNLAAAGGALAQGGPADDASRPVSGADNPGRGEGTATAALAELFRPSRRAVTAFTWVAFFMAFGALTILAMWIPVILRMKGLGAAQASVVLGIFGFGAFAGALGAGRLVERFGGLPVLILCFLAGALTAFGCGVFANSFSSVSLWMAFAGVFVTAGASGLVAVAATVYPAAIRSTAVGCAMGMGRGGQAIWPLVIGLVLSTGASEVYVLGAAGLCAVAAACAVAGMSIAARWSAAARAARPRSETAAFQDVSFSNRKV